MQGASVDFSQMQELNWTGESQWYSTFERHKKHVASQDMSRDAIGPTLLKRPFMHALFLVSLTQTNEGVRFLV